MVWGGVWQPTEDDNMRCSRTTQVCHLIGAVYKSRAICCRSSCKWFFQVWPFATVYFTFLAFQCCQMFAKKQPWQWPLTFEKKNTASQRTGQTSQPSWQDEARIKVCFFQIGPAGTAQLLPSSTRNLRAILKVQLLQGRVAQDFQQVCGPIGTNGVIPKAPGALKRGLLWYTAPWEEKGTFMPSKPQSSKKLAFVGGRPYYHLDGAKRKICHKPQKNFAW